MRKEKTMTCGLFIALALGACGHSESGSNALTAGVSYSPQAEALVAQPWTVKGKQKPGKGKRTPPAPDTVYRFGRDSILVKTYRVEDQYSSRGFRLRKEITSYHLSGDTLVYYDGRPVRGVIRQLTDTTLVIRYPGYTARMEHSRE